MRLGPWMKKYRDQFFLATKTNERTYQDAKDQFQRSLDRLQVDRVDLLQFHNLTDIVEREIIMGPGGALEFFLEAREAGLARFSASRSWPRYTEVSSADPGTFCLR